MPIGASRASAIGIQTAGLEKPRVTSPAEKAPPAKVAERSEEPPTHVSRQTVGHHQVGGEEAIDRLVNSFVEDTIGEKLDRIEARLDAIHEYFQKKEKFLFEKLKKL